LSASFFKAAWVSCPAAVSFFVHSAPDRSNNLIGRIQLNWKVIMKNPSATKKGSGRYHKQGHKKNKPAKK
jgi:hypothetical protein